jgi:hypothetical protein
MKMICFILKVVKKKILNEQVLINFRIKYIVVEITRKLR